MALASVTAAALCHLVFVRVAGGIFPHWEAWHAVHISGQSRPPLQFRWLSYMLPEWLHRCGMPVVDAYLAMRFICLAGALMVTARIGALLGLGPQGSLAVVMAVGLYYTASSQAHIQPAEEPNLLLMSLFTWAVVSRRSLLMKSAILAIAMLFKETIGFLIPFAVLVAWSVSPRRAVAEGAVLGSLFILVYASLRIALANDQTYLGGLWQVQENLTFFRDNPVAGLAWVLPSVLPVAVILASWRRHGTVVRAFIPSALLLVLGHLLISRIEEFRTYTVLAPLLWSACLAILAHGEPKDGRPHVPDPRVL